MKSFLNLPVKDLQKSINFFTKLGFTFNPNFTDEKATCMIINEESFVMLLVESFFKTFTTKEIPDTTKTAQLILAVSVESKDEVVAMVDIALAQGATPAGERDLGFMYNKDFYDLDGHKWEIFWMDESQIPA